jgi:hypothetical protein
MIDDDYLFDLYCYITAMMQPKYSRLLQNHVTIVIQHRNPNPSSFYSFCESTSIVNVSEQQSAPTIPEHGAN